MCQKSQKKSQKIKKNHESQTRRKNARKCQKGYKKGYTLSLSLIDLFYLVHTSHVSDEGGQPHGQVNLA
jgi:hypothetical protein